MQPAVVLPTIGSRPLRLAFVLDPLPGTPFGAIVMKDDMQLANALLKAFQDIQANGEYDKILTKWGLEEYKLAPVINGTK